MPRLRLTTMVVLALGCSSQSSAPNTFDLDRPADMAFACVGTQTTGGVSSGVALPPGSCSPSAAPDAGPPAEADGGTDAGPSVTLPGTLFGFVAEPARGDVMVINLTTAAGIKDNDRLTPGRNGLPVGRQPVAAVTLPGGCHVVTANQGSCDFAVIDVLKATSEKPGAVSRQLAYAGGAPLYARPGAIETLPSEPPPTPPISCDDVRGTAYVSYPACGLVARLDLATGDVLDGVRFAAGAPPAIVSGDAVVCPAECEAPSGDPDAGTGDPDAGVPEPAGAEPVALAVEPDGSRLYTGARDSSSLVIVDLDVTGRPLAVQELPLAGAGGILRLAATGEVAMGNGAAGVPMRFVYAIAADGTVHVADVTPAAAPRECDTQVDRRFLHDVSDPALLACLPVGDPATPPRRATARGPGIQLPGGAVPLDVAFFTRAEEPAIAGLPEPDRRNGTFALVSALGPAIAATRGTAFYVNVDDETYEDAEDPDEPRTVDMALALPHSLRDAVGDRRQEARGCVAPTFPSVGDGPARIDGAPFVQEGLIYNFNGDDPADPFVPMLHRIQCSGTRSVFEMADVQMEPLEDPTGEVDPVRDLAHAEFRERLFPDLGQVPQETWTVAWEGTLHQTGSTSRRQGGRVTTNGSTLTVSDASGGLCALGAEPRDVVQLLGCSASVECGIGEVCFLHAETPQGMGGLCFPEGQLDELAGRCAQLARSVRKYTVSKAFGDRLDLAARPRVMRATPLSGCVDDAQCTVIHDGERQDAATASGLDVNDIPRYTFECRSEPELGGPDRCVMVCGQDLDPGDDCDLGSVCQQGRCVLGPVPPSECIATLQRYEVRAGEAFSVVGSKTGYLHPFIEDDATGACVLDPAASPLRVGRFHRDEPVCTEDLVQTVDPNPCRVEGLQEPYVDASGEIVLRDTRAIRFRSAGMTFHVADIVIPHPYAPGDYYSPTPVSFEFRFAIGGGFSVLEAGDTLGSPLALQLPSRVRVDPAGNVWFIDSAESQGGGTRGQLLRLDPEADDSPFRID